MIKDCKQPPHFCITSPGAHTTMQVACSVSTKPDLMPTDILVSFPFPPLLGALICTFLYIYVSSYIFCTPLSQTTSPCALKLGSLLRWARLCCISFLPACPPSPLYVPSSPADCCTTPVPGRQKWWGHCSCCLRSLLLPSLGLSLCEIESVFLTAGNEGRCLNPFLLFS